MDTESSPERRGNCAGIKVSVLVGCGIWEAEMQIERLNGVISNISVHFAELLNEFGLLKSWKKDFEQIGHTGDSWSISGTLLSRPKYNNTGFNQPPPPFRCVRRRLKHVAYDQVQSAWLCLELTLQCCTRRFQTGFLRHTGTTTVHPFQSREVAPFEAFPFRKRSEMSDTSHPRH